MKVYLRILENNEFGFMVEGINQDIRESDIEITTADYNTFFENINIGKHYRLAEQLPEDGGLFDYLEEYTPEEEPLPPTEIDLLKEQIELLDGALNEVLFTILPEMQGGEI